MLSDGKLLIAKGEAPVYLLPQMVNRHGLIAGATGTGKTITLKVIAESLSDAGVPVFLADVKGDISGMCRPGEGGAKLQERLDNLNISDFSYTAFPTRFFDVFGAGGHPVRTTISEMGPVLLARLLDLTEVQAGVLSLVFRIADDKGLLLIDMKDLRAMLRFIGDSKGEYTTEYGNASRASIGAIQRALLTLEDAGGSEFFGEPALDVDDWIKLSDDGRGFINILDCRRLFHEPLLYSTFMLWLLTELFERLPEVGDLDKPRIAFFFDEAHLLFTDAPRSLLTKLEQVVKLIRSKGVGVYFITQNPSDLPDAVLAQLGNRVQHALRAYTPNEIKSVKAAANSFRANPAFNTEEAILDLSTGEALISFLDEKGRPSVVERATVLPPQSLMGVIDDERRKNEIEASGLYGKYDTETDRESAYELLTGAAAAPGGAIMEQPAPAQPDEISDEEYNKLSRYEQIKLDKQRARARQMEAEASPAPKEKKKGKTKADKALGRVTSSAMSSIGRELGRRLSRGIFGLLKD